MPSSPRFGDPITEPDLPHVFPTSVVRGRKTTAAAFLKEFVDDTPWAHLDIAGTAWGDPATPFRAKGPTGIAVRTLIEFIERASR